MKILYPVSFLLLIAVVLIPVFSAVKNRNKRFDFSAAKFLFEIEKDKTNLKMISNFMKYLALVFLITALARPVTVKYIESDIQKSALDIMFCVDISTSMQEETNGLSTGIEIAGDILYELSRITGKERTGLVVFAYSAYTVMPLSFDHNSIEYYAVNLYQYPGTIQDGTAIWDSIMVGANRLDAQSGTSRAIVVITDGDNNSGISVPSEVSGYLLENGIRLYCVNITANRTEQTYLIESTCEQTGGKFFILNSSSSVEKVWNEIKKLERDKIVQTEYFENYVDHYPVLLIFAAVFLALAVNIEFISCKGVIL